jgi:hypothetical protein
MVVFLKAPPSAMYSSKAINPICNIDISLSVIPIDLSGLMNGMMLHHWQQARLLVTSVK